MPVWIICGIRLAPKKRSLLPIINGRRQKNGILFRYTHPFRLPNSNKEVYSVNFEHFFSN